MTLRFFVIFYPITKVFRSTPLCPGLNTVAKNWLQIVVAILAKKLKGNCCQKCVEEIENIAKIINSTMIESCSKNLLVTFCPNFSKNLFNRNCSQKSKEVFKNRIK